MILFEIVKGKNKYKLINSLTKIALLKAKTHERLIMKIESWLTVHSIDQMIVNKNGTLVRIQADEQDAYIESVDSVITDWFASSGVNLTPDTGRDE